MSASNGQPGNNRTTKRDSPSSTSSNGNDANNKWNPKWLSHIEVAKRRNQEALERASQTSSDDNTEEDPVVERVDNDQPTEAIQISSTEFSQQQQILGYHLRLLAHTRNPTGFVIGHIYYVWNEVGKRQDLAQVVSICEQTQSVLLLWWCIGKRFVLGYADLYRLLGEQVEFTSGKFVLANLCQQESCTARIVQAPPRITRTAVAKVVVLRDEGAVPSRILTRGDRKVSYDAVDPVEICLRDITDVGTPSSTLVIPRFSSRLSALGYESGHAAASQYPSYVGRLKEVHPVSEVGEIEPYEGWVTVQWLTAPTIVMDSRTAEEGRSGHSTPTESIHDDDVPLDGSDLGDSVASMPPGELLMVDPTEAEGYDEQERELQQRLQTPTTTQSAPSQPGSAIAEAPPVPDFSKYVTCAVKAETLLPCAEIAHVVILTPGIECLVSQPPCTGRPKQHNNKNKPSTPIGDGVASGLNTSDMAIHNHTALESTVPPPNFPPDLETDAVSFLSEQHQFEYPVDHLVVEWRKNQYVPLTYITHSHRKIVEGLINNSKQSALGDPDSVDAPTLYPVVSPNGRRLPQRRRTYNVDNELIPVPLPALVHEFYHEAVLRIAVESIQDIPPVLNMATVEHADILGDITVLSPLSEQIIRESNSVTPTETEVTLRKLIRQQLQDFFRKELENNEIKCYCFGSTGSYLLQHYSDIDLCVILDPDDKNATLSRAEIREKLTDMMGLISRIPAGSKLVGDYESILGARVQLIRRKQHPTLDISLASWCGVRNTALFRLYVHTYPILKPLIQYIIKWSKVAGLNDVLDGLLNSYTLYIMLVHFLIQSGKILLIPINSDLEIHEYPDLPDPPPQGSWIPELGRLASYFFYYYYACFDFETRVVTMRTQYALTRSFKGWMNDALCVEDPYETHLNTARVVTWPRFQQICNSMGVAHNALARGVNVCEESQWENACAEWAKGEDVLYVDTPSYDEIMSSVKNKV